MTDVEILALIRATICAVALPFAVRGRYLFLSLVLAIGCALSVLAMVGTARVVTGVIAIPLYGLLAAHTLDITRRRHQP